MNRIPRAALALLAALALVPLAAGAQAEAGTVNVVVQTSGGGPLAGAAVTLESGDRSSYAREGETDAAGAASFADVPLGEVLVKVYDAQGQLVTEGQGFLEKAGEAITLILQPEPEG